MAGPFHPPFSFRSCRKENGPHPVQKKRTPRRVGPRKRVPPAAGGGWLALSCRSFDKTRCPWGNLGSGEGPDTLASSFRWRWPGGQRGPTRASAPTGDHGNPANGRAHRSAPTAAQHSACRPIHHSRRGGCPHPPVSRPPSTTKQNASESRRTDLSTPTPKFPPDRQSRRKTRATERIGASRQKITLS